MSDSLGPGLELLKFALAGIIFCAFLGGIFGSKMIDIWDEKEALEEECAQVCVSTKSKRMDGVCYCEDVTGWIKSPMSR